MKTLPLNDAIFCEQEIEVRWGDCDAAGIVYYAKYFDWFSDGRTGLLKQVNMPYHSHFHGQGIVMVAVEAHCRYRKSLKLEEKFKLRTRVCELNRAHMAFEYTITRQDDGTVAAIGKTVHAYVDYSGKPFDIKKKYPELWAKLYDTFVLKVNSI